MAEIAPHKAEDLPVLHGPINLGDADAVSVFIASLLSRTDGVTLNPVESAVVADLFSYRLSTEGRAIGTFSWKCGMAAASKLVLLPFADRVTLANKVLKLASGTDCVIEDGRWEGGGLQYYEEVKHLLVAGKLPDEIATNTPGKPFDEQRFEKYKTMANLAERAYRTDPYYTEPKPWGESRRYVWLVIEDAIRILWPSTDHIVGWKFSNSNEESSSKPSKKRGVSTETAGDATAVAASAPKRQNRCKACGELKKGHKCQIADKNNKK